MIRWAPIIIAMISTITKYMASAAMTAKKMKAKVMKIITTALTTTIKIISKITIKDDESWWWQH